MKFRATVVLDLEASSIAEAGEQLNKLVMHAKRDLAIDTRDVQLGTAPRSEPVMLPLPVSSPERGRAPGPPAPPDPRYSPPTARRILASERG